VRLDAGAAAVQAFEPDGTLVAMLSDNRRM
jgi:hypothetical protein